MRSWCALTSALTVCVAILAAAAVACFSTISLNVQLLGGAVLIMGGNDNPNGQNMERQLNNYFNPDHPNYGFPGSTLTKVVWPADISDGYMPAQFEGVRNLDAAISAALAQADHSGDEVVAVGYSSSANVVVRTMRILAATGGPSPEKLRFIAFGSPNRPHGGVFSRFPDVQLSGDLEIDNDGPNPDTDYRLLDISWEYDPISDFPTYLLNPIALINTLLAFEDLHGYYFDADLADTIQNSTLTGTAPDGTEYVTIAAPGLPLLRPLRALQVPEPLLLAVEPALKVLVDLAYDRTVPVWEPTRIRLLPPPAAVLRAIPDLLRAIGVGIHNALEAIRGLPTDETGPSVGPAPVGQGTHRTSSAPLDHPETTESATPAGRAVADRLDHPASAKRPSTRTDPRETIEDPARDPVRAETSTPDDEAAEDETARAKAVEDEVADSKAEAPCDEALTGDGQTDSPEKSAATGRSGKAERSQQEGAEAGAHRGRDTGHEGPGRTRDDGAKQSDDAA